MSQLYVLLMFTGVGKMS